MIKIISQILGVFAFIFFLFSIQNKEKKKILNMQLISNLFYTISYLLLNALPAVIIDIISGIRCIWYTYLDGKNKHTSVIAMIVLIFLSIIVGIFTVINVYDTLPIIISIIYIVTTWQNNVRIIQYGFIVAACLWIIYNLHIGTFTPLIGNVFEIISGVVAMIRIKEKDKKIVL